VAAHLTQKLIRGIPWIAGESLFNILCSVLTVVLIGRFIAPAEFGLATTATATVLLVELLSSAGIAEAVVRARSGDTIVTDTAFVAAMAFAFMGMGYARSRPTRSRACSEISVSLRSSSRQACCFR
jgi:O-antigen/teichoic acid export membrane protein